MKSEVRIAVLYFISVLQTITIAIYSYNNYMTIVGTIIMIYSLTMIAFLKSKKTK